MLKERIDTVRYTLSVCTMFSKKWRSMIHEDIKLWCQFGFSLLSYPLGHLLGLIHVLYFTLK